MSCSLASGALVFDALGFGALGLAALGRSAAGVSAAGTGLVLTVAATAADDGEGGATDTADAAVGGAAVVSFGATASSLRLQALSVSATIAASTQLPVRETRKTMLSQLSNGLSDEPSAIKLPDFPSSAQFALHHSRAHSEYSGYRHQKPELGAQMDALPYRPKQKI